MRELICPKCGAGYERHPLDPAHQELCPACRNKASWDDIRAELADASKLKMSGVPAARAVAADQEARRAGA